MQKMAKVFLGDDECDSVSIVKDMVCKEKKHLASIS